MAEQPPTKEQPPAAAPALAAAFPTPKPVEGRAIAALVVGILAPVSAFVLLGVTGVLLGAVAVFLGLTARRRIKQSGGALGGGGMALAGWICGLVGIGLGLLWAVYLLGLFFAMSSGGKG